MTLSRHFTPPPVTEVTATPATLNVSGNFCDLTQRAVRQQIGAELIHITIIKTLFSFVLIHLAYILQVFRQSGFQQLPMFDKDRVGHGRDMPIDVPQEAQHFKMHVAGQQAV